MRRSLGVSDSAPVSRCAADANAAGGEFLAGVFGEGVGTAPAGEVIPAAERFAGVAAMPGAAQRATEVDERPGEL